jgi:hypothetical protein
MMDNAPPDLLLPREGELSPATNGRRKHRALMRFRRNLGQFLGDADARRAADVGDAEADLRLQVMLLREENARLKGERHRPSDVGTLIDQLRLLAAEAGHGQAGETWDVVSESLAICAELEQALSELQAAVAGVQRRLRSVTLRMENAAQTSERISPNWPIDR